MELIGKLREYGSTILITIAAAIFLRTFVVEAFHIPSVSMENSLFVGDFVLVNKFVYGARTPSHLPFLAAEIPFFRIPGFKKVQRGDILVFEFPGERDEVNPSKPVNFVKRCVAVSGDTVLIVNSVLFVNGKMFPEMNTMRRDLSLPKYYRDKRIFPPGSSFNKDHYGPLVVPKRGDVLALDQNSVRVWETFIRREGRSAAMNAHGTILIDNVPSNHYVVERNYVFVMGDNRDNSLDSRFCGFVPEENIIGEAILIYWSWDNNVSMESPIAKFNSIRWERIGTIIQ